MKLRSIRYPVFLSMALFCALTVLARQAHALSLIRDAETEYIIREYSEPIFEAAGLDPEIVNIHLINDKRINAFVADGQRIFIHTGLIRKSATPDMLIGVIAHETGHIAGGHLSSRQLATEKAQIPFLLSTLVGMGALVAGATDAGLAIIAGGQSAAIRNLRQYTRAQESSADQAAVTYLDRVGWSGQGLIKTFQLFRGQEISSGRQQDPYLRTHPVSRERMAALERRVMQSPYKNHPGPKGWQARHEMIKAKLAGFLDRPDVTFRRFPPEDQSPAAHYARAIAYHKSSQTKKALAQLAFLIGGNPENPFFHELKGQILMESGKAQAAVAPLETAVSLLPDSPLVRALLAQAMLETENPALTRPAVRHLQHSLRFDKDNTLAFRQLAIGYARLNETGRASLATAEQFFLLGNREGTKTHALRARKLLPEGSPGWLRAEDLARTVEPE